MVYKRAIVVIHGMGEQRPLDTLDGFMGALLSQYGKPNRRFYSRPARFAESYEARRYIVPPIFDDSDDSTDRRPQTEVFEYHWSHLMRENRLVTRPEGAARGRCAGRGAHHNAADPVDAAPVVDVCAASRPQATAYAAVSVLTL